MVREERLVITINEFANGKLAYVNNMVYNNIKTAFINAIGERITKKILPKYLEKSLQELSCNSFVNIMDCFIVR